MNLASSTPVEPHPSGRGRFLFRRLYVRDGVVFIFLMLPDAVHGLFHLIDYLSNWRANEIVPWLAWAFTSHGGPGFWTHAVINASTYAAAAWGLYRLLWWGRVAYRLLERASSSQRQSPGQKREDDAKREES
jgi:hypothetical protein